MKIQLKKIGTVCLMAGLGLGFFTSCDDDPKPVVFDAKVDAFVQKVKVGDAIKYVPTFYAYANKNLKTVKVVNGSKIYTLAKYAHGGERNFRYIATGAEVVDAMPAAATFKYTVTSADDEVKTIDENVGTEQLGEMAIKALTYESNGTFKITWDKLTDAESYAVKAFDADGNQLFISPIITGATKEFSFGKNSTGWLDQSKKFEDDKSYKIELHAFRYETGTSDKPYNIQFVSVGEKSAKWKPAN
jgi:hypothetical protein